MKSRTSWNRWGTCAFGAALAVVLLLSPAAQAQNPAPAQNPKEITNEETATESPVVGDSFGVQATVIRIKLDDKHTFGSGLATAELEALVIKDKKIPAVCENLRQYGDTSVANDLQFSVTLGAHANAMSGADNPYFESLPATTDKTTPTFRTEHVNSGLNASVGLNPRGNGPIGLHYELDFRDTIPVDIKNPIPGAAEAVREWKRQEVQWRGDYVMPAPSGLFVTKALVTNEGVMTEYFAVVQIAPTAANKSAKASR